MIEKKASNDFNQVAGQWDELNAGFFKPALRETALARAYLRPEWVVADVGGGTGFLTAGLAPQVKKVFLVDASPEMLATARKNLSAFSNVEFRQADGADLPFADESLDAVFAHMYLRHVVDPGEAIREMVRVIRPGGRLVIMDMDRHPDAWFKQEMADVRQGFDRKEIRGWFQQTGLVNILVTSSGELCRSQSASENMPGEQAKAEISVSVASATRRLPMKSAVRQNYAAIAQTGSSCCGPKTGDSPDGCCAPGSGCCSSGPQEVSFSSGYTLVDLSAAPSEAAGFSLGCGNPLALAHLQPGEVVLDIGSGGGLDAFLAADRVGLGGRVIGVDMTPAMLQRARTAAERNQIHNVEFRRGEAEALPVEDGSVDVVLSNCVINLAEDKGQVFHEAFRVLKPGGRLEVSDMVTSGSFSRDFLEDPAGWAECVSGALPEEEYKDLAAEAGFDAVTTRRGSSMASPAGVQVYSVILSARKPARAS